MQVEVDSHHKYSFQGMSTEERDGMKSSILHTLTSVQRTLHNWKIDLTRIYESKVGGTKLRMLNRSILELRKLIDLWPSSRESVFVSKLSDEPDDTAGPFIYVCRCLELYLWDSFCRVEFLKQWVVQSTNPSTILSILSVTRAMKIIIGAYYESILQEKDDKIDCWENEREKKRKRKGERKGTPKRKDHDMKKSASGKTARTKSVASSGKKKV
eukprot:TRINITY_DN336_c2_g1_i1.p1 TRINITY_DN336_c2_g1~~TRINITY_DN336_c2_g1_i1.p1  ORF type:complete len:213 (-),score=47.09 TRINITY_DN336_c2_g1_i1:53-691(-)